ncbi:MAG: ABC transporter permease [Christensenellales bacterium]|jgi:putative aldouronate transport system permease protein
MQQASKIGKSNIKRKSWWMQVFEHRQLYLLLIPALVWLIAFCYTPMYGLLIAFKDFKIRKGIVGSPWSNPVFKYFEQFFSTSIAETVIVNTLLLSLYQLVFSFWVPIVFALMLNQVRHSKLKKTIQTISYAPYFLSNVVLVSVMYVLFSAGGVVNTIISNSGGEIKLFTSQAQYFRPMYIGSTIYQTMGFNAIIYIAALTSISPEYYEAAMIDGASKIKRIWYIDIPLIMPTVILMFILSLGSIMTIGYEKAFLMQSPANTTVSEIISTHVYKVGLRSAQYSYATAVGLFNSVVNFIILFFANMLSKKTADISIF